MKTCLLLLTGVLLAIPFGASADDLSNRAFQIQYDASGVHSLRRTNDVHDTDYIAPRGALGRLLIRYRTTVNGDWRELSELLPQPSNSPDTIRYALGVRMPALGERSSASAAVGAGGLRALNDGEVPIVAGGGGRGGGGSPGARPAPALFTWSGSRGTSQWVQYTFPGEQEVSRVEVFWAAGPDAGGVSLPRSWRLLYEEGHEWKEVRAHNEYALKPNAFTELQFDPVRTLAMRIEVTLAPDARAGIAEWRVGPPPALVPSADLAVSEAFKLDDEVLEWTIALDNETDRVVEVGDLAVPLPFAERTGARGDIYTRKLLRHALVAGHGSWVYWQRSGGDGPYLVMAPQGSTKFEYADNSGGGTPGVYTPYIHAAVSSAAAVADGGNWRLPISSLRLQPRGSGGASVTYTFRFRWAADTAAVRDVLYDEGQTDTAVVPGMVVPVDLDARFSLRTKRSIARIDAEHPDDTRISDVGVRAGGAHVYRVEFSALGENMLTVRYADGRWSTLEFFVTEPLETLIRKRARFLVTHQQHTDLSKWYAGAYGDWDQKNEVLRGPEDRDGLSTWLTDADDDAGNARPAFLASKNVFYPDKREIESLELYINRYLWGGMQMTDTEQYPYAIYGIPNWKANRESPDPGRNGRAHVWRIYDYPHIVMLYFRMYQIATFYPDMTSSLDAATYLERAYRTALAYWTVPKAVEDWSADAVGTMNEAIIPEVIDALEREGRREWARTLRGYWEGKVARFVNDPPNLYGSEFAFDSTGFESTGAFAHYAVAHAAAPGQPLPANVPSTDFRRRVTYDGALKFMNFQLLLNTIDRGWLESTYYQLGSDYRGSLSYLLSYMSQMGGWSILDYALNFAKDPTPYLRLGYASSLSSWALVNSGTEDGGYGYWFPSANNDGAAGGGFVPEAMGRGWIGKAIARGAWYYSAEEDVGYCGALRTHATIVARDPIFGEIAYGGVLSREGDSVRVIPRDGLRVRFSVIRNDQRLHLTLDRDGFAKEQPIVVADDLSRIEFTMENRAGTAHRTRLSVGGLPSRQYTVSVDGHADTTVDGASREIEIELPAGGGHILFLARSSAAVNIRR